MHRTAWLAAACCVCTTALAQDSPALASWLASSQAQAFRERVVQLALIYGDSSGIDPHGLRIVTRRVDETRPGCGHVLVQALEDGNPVLQQTVEACRHQAGGRG